MIPQLPWDARPDTVALVGWTLLHFVWQGAAVAALFAAVNAALSRASAEARYAAGAAALLLMLALPVATFFTLSARAVPPADPAITRVTAVPGDPMTSAPAASLSAAERPATASAPRALPRPLVRMLPGMVALWSFGVALLSLRVLLGWLAAERLRRSGVAPAPEAWQATIMQLAARMEVRTVRLMESVRVEVPSVIGWLKPVVLVPSSTFTGLTPAQIEAVLAHELAHIRRHDFAANLVQTLVETLLFYHPAVWWVSRRVRIERENCCDDLAIAVCGDPVGYARALAELESLRVPSLVMAATGGSLIERIARLVRGTPRRVADPPMWVGPLVALAMLTGLAGVTGATRASDSIRVTKPMIAAARELAIHSRELAREAASLAGAVARTGSMATALVSDRENLEALATLARDLPLSDLTALADCADPKIAKTGDAGDHGCPDAARAAEDTEDADLPKIDLSEDELLKLAENGLTPRSIRGYLALGITSGDDIVALSQNGVDARYIRAFRELGYADLDASDFVQMRQQGVEVGDVESLHDLGYDRVPVSDLITLRQHGVEPRFVAGMKWLGFEDLPLDRQIAMRDQGVTVEEIARYRVLGYRDLSDADYIRLRQQGVTPEYAGMMRRFRQEPMPADDLIKLRQQGVAPDWVLGLRGLGYSGLECDELVTMRQQGVELEWLAGIAENGYDHLSVEEIVQLRQQDVSGPFIRACREAGFKKLSVAGLIRLRQLGVVSSSGAGDGQ